MRRRLWPSKTTRLVSTSMMPPSMPIARPGWLLLNSGTLFPRPARGSLPPRGNISLSVSFVRITHSAFLFKSQSDPTLIIDFSLNGAPIGNTGGALRQALANQQFPDGYVKWGGQTLPINSFLLDITGILFAAQLVTLLILGPYADYGNWRPWIMIISQTILCKSFRCFML